MTTADFGRATVRALIVMVHVCPVSSCRTVIVPLLADPALVDV
jgi:hypothetical protein